MIKKLCTRCTIGTIKLLNLVKNRSGHATDFKFLHLPLLEVIRCTKTLKMKSIDIIEESKTHQNTDRNKHYSSGQFFSICLYSNSKNKET